MRRTRTRRWRKRRSRFGGERGREECSQVVEEREARQMDGEYPREEKREIARKKELAP